MTKYIWIDIDNAPHVLFFRPFLKEFKKRKENVLLTIRYHEKLIQLLSIYGINEYSVIGCHPGRNKIKKALNLFIRAYLLNKLVNLPIKVAVAHASRGIVLPAYLHKIPLIILYDYEYIFDWLFRKFATIIGMPEVISKEYLKNLKKEGVKYFLYPGIKEGVYLFDFQPQNFRLPDIDYSKCVILIRPPATTAHYHNPESEKIFAEIIDYYKNSREVEILIIPRSEREINILFQKYFNVKNLHILKTAVDGPTLICNADAVISGGGTMVREACVLGIPAYSFFKGKKGGVDKYLEKVGLLKFINSAEDLKKIKFKSNKEEAKKLREIGKMGFKKIIEVIEEVSKRRYD